MENFCIIVQSRDDVPTRYIVPPNAVHCLYKPRQNSSSPFTFHESPPLHKHLGSPSNSMPANNLGTITLRCIPRLRLLLIFSANSSRCLFRLEGFVILCLKRVEHSLRLCGPQSFALRLLPCLSIVSIGSYQR